MRSIKVEQESQLAMTQTKMVVQRLKNAILRLTLNWSLIKLREIV